jgi:DNA-binding response OmpR family regulator
MAIYRQDEISIALIIGDQQLQDIIALILLGESYNVHTFSSYQQAVGIIKNQNPDLIIADFDSCGIDGLHLTKELRKNFILKFTPIILMVPPDDHLIKMKVIYAGADDFLEKPFSNEELLARVKAATARIYHLQDVNPLTKLAGSSTAIKEISTKIEAKEIFGAARCDLSNLRRFNERYGFHKGDEVIIMVKNIIAAALNNLGGHSDGLFHLGNDDFIFLSSPEAIEDICRKIIENFKLIIPSFYEPQDRQNGYIAVKNRKGEIEKIPLFSLRIGIVTNTNFPFISHIQVTQIINELYVYAKQFNKSLYIKERRKSCPFK